MLKKGRNPSSSTSSPPPKSIYLCFAALNYDSRGREKRPDPNMWRKIDIDMKEDTTTFVSQMPEKAPRHCNSVALDSVIYSLGSSTSEVYYLDTLRPDIGWKKAPSLLHPRDYLYYLTANAGKIYAVGKIYPVDPHSSYYGYTKSYKEPPVVQDEHWAEVLDPLFGVWKPFLGPDCETLAKALDRTWSQPSGEEVLLDSKDGLFLYNVDCNSWKVVNEITSTTKWEGAIVDNDIVYYFYRKVKAYDLGKGRFFEKKVKGLEVGKVSPYLRDYNGFGSPDPNYPEGFVVYVGEGRLCLLYESPMGLHCTRFRVFEYSDGDEDIEIFATIEAYRVYEVIQGYELQQCLVI